MTRTPRTTRVALLAALSLSVAVGGAAVAAAPAAPPGQQEGNGEKKEKTNRGAVEQGRSYERFLVHFAGDSAAQDSDAAAQDEVEQVARSSGRGLQVARRLSTGGVLVQVSSRLDPQQAQDLIARFVERAGVAYAEPDVQMTATLTPNDPRYGAQWHYGEPLAGMNLPTAWNDATGTGVTVAVLDTGITSHSDLDANVVSGYDFISSSAEARDGNGRDANPADQGDWHSAFDCLGSTGGNSSWHGTHVAGTVAAATNNGTGVSGVAFGAKIQPVRVLGRCGGTLADISDAITWASGGTVPGVPANPTPSKVINMSLGGSGTCGAAYQNAINGAVARGTAVVVAAGNSNANASGYQPSSCANTVVVAASDREGNRASYSNYGTIVDLAAPGGETATQANGVLSTFNAGTTVPAAESYGYYQGTSMATPHVAGLAALVLGRQAMSPADLEAALKAGTRALPGVCSGGCGAGLADAAKTIAALAPSAPSPAPSPTTQPTTAPSPAPTEPSASPTTSPTTEPTTGPTTQPSPAPASFDNGTDVAIQDRRTVESPITVSGRTGNAPTALGVPVTLNHPRSTDLRIDLVAPDGTVYPLVARGAGTPASTTHTVNASSEPANGTWLLRISDQVKGGGSGTLDTWGLRF